MQLKKWIVFFLLLTVSDMIIAQDATPESRVGADRLILATTTSTADSGLLDVILPDFEEKFGVTVDVVAVGTGQALELGRNGDADVVLVHARADEDTFVEEGYGVERLDVMYNDFVILGPEDDPSGIAGLPVEEAFAKLAESGAAFISRGDDSGTHKKELAIWKAIDYTPEPGWYVSAGQGMGAVLNMANELQGYTLSDRATFLARRAEGLELVVLVEGDDILLNPYGVIAVNPELHPAVNAEVAQQFVEWLTSVETQDMIAAYQIDGEQLFFPDSAVYQEAMMEATPEVTPES